MDFMQSIYVLSNDSILNVNNIRSKKEIFIYLLSYTLRYTIDKYTQIHTHTYKIKRNIPLIRLSTVDISEDNRSKSAEVH